MIYLKTEDEIDKLRCANRLVGLTLAEIAKIVKPGVTTREMDTLAEQFIRDHGAEPTFKGFPNPYGEPFPASICTSVNNVVIHGIPNDEPLREGDIVSVDCGTFLDGFCGDSCYTFCVGEVAPEVRQLLTVTKESLYLAIQQAIVGHGIGREMHEDPAVPNYGKRGNGKQLKNGLCIAIEPMITMGSPEIGLLPDKWGVVTRDGSMAAHFEHTIAIHHGKAEILSSFTEIEEVERQAK